MLPLAALCLVAGHAVGVFGLQGVVVGIVKRRRDLFREFSLGAGGYAVVERFHLVAGNPGPFGHQAAQHQLGRDDAPVRHLQLDFREVASVHLLGVAGPGHFGHVTVGYQRARLVDLAPVIIVLGDDQTVAPHHGLLEIHDLGADGFVEIVGAPVGAGDDQRLVLTDLRIGVGEFVGQFAAADDAHVGEASGFEMHGHAGVGHHELQPHQRGIVYDSPLIALPHRDVQHMHQRIEAEFAEPVLLHGIGLCLAHGWQLGLVAHEKHAASGCRIDILYQQLEQRAVAAASRVGNQRCLVDYKQSVACLVARQHVASARGVGDVGPEQSSVDCRRRVRRHMRGNLCSASGGGQHHHGTFQTVHGLDQSPDERGLARARVAVQHKHVAVAARRGEIRHAPEHVLLLFQRRERQRCQRSAIQIVGIRWRVPEVYSVKYCHNYIKMINGALRLRKNSYICGEFQGEYSGLIPSPNLDKKETKPKQ